MIDWLLRSINLRVLRRSMMALIASSAVFGSFETAKLVSTNWTILGNNDVAGSEGPERSTKAVERRRCTITVISRSRPQLSRLDQKQREVFSYFHPSMPVEAIDPEVQWLTRSSQSIEKHRSGPSLAVVRNYRYARHQTNWDKNWEEPRSAVVTRPTEMHHSKLLV